MAHQKNTQPNDISTPMPKVFLAILYFEEFNNPQPNYIFYHPPYKFSVRKKLFLILRTLSAIVELKFTQIIGYIMIFLNYITFNIDFLKVSQPTIIPYLNLNYIHCSWKVLQTYLPTHLE